MNIKGRPVDPKSKLSRARRMYRKSIPRHAAIKEFIRRLHLTPAGASRYHQICRSA